MSFYRQFDEYDPLTGDVAAFPFSLLPYIVHRARSLLAGRSRDEIISAARNVDWFIEEYFRAKIESYIERLLKEGGPELAFLPEEQRDEVGVRRLLDNWPFLETDVPPPDIPTRDNTLEVKALKECISLYGLDDAETFPGGREFEYFAVLALWFVGDCLACLRVDWITHEGELPDDQHIEYDDPISSLPAGLQETIRASTKWRDLDGRALNLNDAGEKALEAMDAVCYAEHLKATEAQAEQLAQLRIELQEQSRLTDELAEARAKEKISVAASNAAIKRNQENRALKALVFDWYKANKNEFPSMDKAAEAAFAKKLVPVTVRTLRDWIGEWAKEVRSARTP